MGTHNSGCTCGLCAPVPGKRYDPEWGFDLDKVAGMSCLSCGEKIGDEPYELDLGWARFGSMSFKHRRCFTDANRKHNAAIRSRQLPSIKRAKRELEKRQGGGN